MSENYGFFNSQKQTDGSYDRPYDANDFARFFSQFISNGVYKGDGLNVVPKDGLTVTLRAGKAFINGYWYELTEDVDFTLSANSASGTRYDLITITLDKTQRKIYARKKENVYAGLPERSDSVYDLGVARISVGVGTSTITGSMIEDMRANNDFCGFVTGLIEQVDFQSLFNQFQSQFDEWFDGIKNKLGTDIAGSLQNQIDDINEKTVVIEKTTNEIGGLYIAYAVSFPSGFNKSNCYVKSIGIVKESGTGVGDDGKWYYGEQADYGIKIGASLSNDVGIRAEADRSFKGRYKWRIVLEKIS